jgi:hypothetical protein
MTGCDLCAQAGFKSPQAFACFAITFDLAPQAGEIAVLFGGGYFVGFDV